jgi:tRNA threonylcarbamoyl adenosine modification protein YjeE
VSLKVKKNDPAGSFFLLSLNGNPYLLQPKEGPISWYHEEMKESFLIGEADLSALSERVMQVITSRPKDTATVVLLDGDLGAGKTTFTKILAEGLGIEKENVQSPTFILKKQYPSSHPRFRRLIHVDAYRFTHPDEAKVLRLEEDLHDPQNLIAIEWPSRMTHLKADVSMTFKVIDEYTRDITLEYEESI